jgi:hypothetical protein
MPLDLIRSCSYCCSGTLPIPSHAPHRNNVVFECRPKNLLRTDSLTLHSSFIRYHLQNDELAGSWFFFFACVPAAPYTLIYLAAGGYRSLIYIAGFFMSLIVCIGAFLFVLACYPSDAAVRTLCPTTY